MSDDLRILAVPALSDNYVWLLADASGAAIAVDPGEAAPVRVALDREGLYLAAVLLTHHHPDHIGGTHDLIAGQDIPVYAPHDERIVVATHRVADGERVTLAEPNLHFSVIEIPGHTRSHIAYYGHGVVFCGDTLFSVGCGRMFEGTPPQMLASLDRLAALPGDTLICCGHEYTVANGRFAMAVEPDNLALEARIAQARLQRSRKLPTVPSQLGEERACNPFLRVDQPSVRRTLAARGEPAGDRTSAFAALRSWKDRFAA
jgi:hydroxyacylglutathione hydrolase